MELGVGRGGGVGGVSGRAGGGGRGGAVTVTIVLFQGLFANTCQSMWIEKKETN